VKIPASVAALPAVLFTLACGGGGAPGPEAARGTATPAPTGRLGTASISGRVTYGGVVPAAKRLPLAADPWCAETRKEGLAQRPIRVKDGALGDVLVYVRGGLVGSYPPPPEEVLLDQVGCDYSPHMLVQRVGQKLRIRNSDDTLHNVHPRPKTNGEWNIAQPRKGTEVTKSFERSEIGIPVGCDVHPWMRAHISVLDHPFFGITGEDGRFEIKALPAGEYEIEAWHAMLKTRTTKLTVKDGEAASLDLAFGG